MKLALSLAVILGLALVSQAALVYTATQNGITVSVNTDTSSTAPTISGLTAYVVTLADPVGIYSVDGRIDAAAGGYLYQTWGNGSDTPSPLGAPATNTANLKNDTHILVPTSSQVISRGADEDLFNFDYLDVVADPDHLHDGTTLCGVNGNEVGDGTNDWSKTMAFGVKTSGTLTNLTSFPFARVVLNSASNNVGFWFRFAVSDGTNLANFNFNPIPEPMTLSLVAAGALALIRRRR